MVEGDVTADVYVLGGLQPRIDSYSSTIERKAQLAGKLEVGPDADRDQHEVGRLATAVGERGPDHSIALEVPPLDLGPGAHVDGVPPMDVGVDLAHLAAQRALERHRQRLDQQHLLAEG